MTTKTIDHLYSHIVNAGISVEEANTLISMIDSGIANAKPVDSIEVECGVYVLRNASGEVLYTTPLADNYSEVSFRTEDNFWVSGEAKDFCGKMTSKLPLHPKPEDTTKEYFGSIERFKVYIPKIAKQ